MRTYQEAMAEVEKEVTELFRKNLTSFGVMTSPESYEFLSGELWLNGHPLKETQAESECLQFAFDTLIRKNSYKESSSTAE
jgi:hypothetical protein